MILRLSRPRALGPDSSSSQAWRVRVHSSLNSGGAGGRITPHCNGPAGRNGPCDSSTRFGARPAVECWSVMEHGRCILFLFVAAISLAGCGSRSNTPGSDPVADAKHALAQGDRRVAGYMGYAMVVPGTPSGF